MSNMGGIREGKTLQSAVSATGNGETFYVYDKGRGSMETLIAQVSGTFTATVTFEGTIDGSTWFAVGGETIATGVIASTATAAGAFRFNVKGLLGFRARVAWTSGTSVTVICSASV
jgi:hypothetical protein